MKPYIKASVVSLALVVSGVLVSPSAQVQIQRGWNVVSQYLDIVGASSIYKLTPSGTSLLLRASTDGGATFSTVGTFTSGGELSMASHLVAPTVTATGGMYPTGTGRAQLASQSAANIRAQSNDLSNTYDITLADWGTTLSAESVSVANAALLFLGSGPVGRLTAVHVTSATLADFQLRGTSTREIYDPDALFSITKDTASSINIYYDAAGASGAGVYVQNLSGGSVSLRLALIGA